MPSLTVTIRGAAELARALGDGELLDDLIRPGFAKASIIVEGAWKRKTHIVTRKYHDSIAEIDAKMKLFAGSGKRDRELGPDDAKLLKVPAAVACDSAGRV